MGTARQHDWGQGLSSCRKPGAQGLEPVEGEDGLFAPRHAHPAMVHAPAIVYAGSYVTHETKHFIYFYLGEAARMGWLQPCPWGDAWGSPFAPSARCLSLPRRSSSRAPVQVRVIESCVLRTTCGSSEHRDCDRLAPSIRLGFPRCAKPAGGVGEQQYVAHTESGSTKEEEASSPPAVQHPPRARPRRNAEAKKVKRASGPCCLGRPALPA